MAHLNTPSEITTLEEQIQQGRFDQAVISTLTDLFLSSRSQRKEGAWELLRLPGAMLREREATVAACPLLLGCRQAICTNTAEPLLQAWRRAQADSEVEKFLGAIGTPISHWCHTQTVMESVAAAECVVKNDYVGVLQHGYRASKWCTGKQPDPVPEAILTLLSEAGMSPLVEAQHVGHLFARLATMCNLQTAEVRDLVLWLVSPLPQREPLRMRKICVPYYVDPQRNGVFTLSVELFDGTGAVYADPITMGFVPRHTDFVTAQEHAVSCIVRLGWRNNTKDVRWSILDLPPGLGLKGGSVGGAFFAALWHLLSDTPNDLSITVSASLTNEGTFQRVNHIHEKIIAIKRRVDLSTLVVAADQSDISEGSDGSLMIYKVRHAADPNLHGGARQ